MTTHKSALFATLLLLTLSITPAPGNDSIPERDIVLIHGIGSSAEVWDEVVPMLEKGFRVWTYELPGHGVTKPHANPTLGIATRDLADFINEYGIDTPVLVGHGLGGMLALSYAFDLYEPVHSLIIIDATPKQMATQEQKEIIAERLLQDYDRFVADYFLSLSDDQDITDRIVDQGLRTDQVSLSQLLVSSFDFDLTDLLPDRDVPMLVIGSKAMLPRPEIAMPHLDAMGYANALTISYKTLPETGHFVMLEEPVLTAGAIIAFALQ